MKKFYIKILEKIHKPIISIESYHEYEKQICWETGYP